MKRALFTTVVAAALVLAVASPHARASDSKLYAGSFCHGRSPSASGAGVFINYSTASMQAQCEMVRDGVNLSRAEVYVVDVHPTEGVSCTLCMKNALSGLGRCVTRSVNTNSYTPTRMFFPAISEVPFGTYAMTCVLPPMAPDERASSIRGYAVIED